MRKLINKIAYWIWFRTRDDYKDFMYIKKTIDRLVRENKIPQ